MTPKERVAMQQALEALEETTGLCINYESVEEKDGYHFTEAPDVIAQGNEAITALREALAEQAEQEPVAWMWKPSKPFPQYTVITDNKEYLKAAKEQGVEITPLYTTPVRTKDLTDDYYELIYAVGNKFPNESRHETALRYIRQTEQGDNQARAVIAADREKNND